MTKYVDNAELSTEVCCKCGILFAMPADYQRRRRNDRAAFYCPSGHGQVYTGPNEEARLKAELERNKAMLEAERARAETIDRQRLDVVTAHTKMRVRVMNGVCPCCNRTFQNLMRHMQTEHAGELTLRTLRTAFGMTQAAVAREIGINAMQVSQHETGKSVAPYAKRAIEAWVSAQEPKPARVVAGAAQGDGS